MTPGSSASVAELGDPTLELSLRVALEDPQIAWPVSQITFQHQEPGFAVDMSPNLLSSAPTKVAPVRMPDAHLMHVPIAAGTVWTRAPDGPAQGLLAGAGRARPRDRHRPVVGGGGRPVSTSISIVRLRASRSWTMRWASPGPSWRGVFEAPMVARRDPERGSSRLMLRVCLGRSRDTRTVGGKFRTWRTTS